MNRSQARAFVTQTFTQSFEKTRFRNFVVNVLNHLDETKAAQWNNTYVKDAFKEHVNKFERLGTYTSPAGEKLDVLVVHLTREKKLERARTAIRNFVADHLKIRDEKDAALVAFVSPSETTWRFSYVKMEYATVENESGKVGVEAKLTPARRFSYIVGEGESCHTAQTRFLELLSDTDGDPTLADIEDAFSVEAVTKEFFTKYAELFSEINAALEKIVAKDKAIRDEFTAKGVNTADFAKKLMGQIVFLYFLQKKGWLGVERGKEWGTGPHDFLRRMARGEYGKYENFFNNILEPLFYDTLATDRGHDAWCNRFRCRIPFLNGGLFEPLGDYNWRKTDITLPNKLFFNSEFFEEGITGTGALDVFDRYNFTVNEAEPLEKEVAIDPEMLGKVFENLIEENLRKGLGAYYTPREIVHFMCQESLIDYLDTTLNIDSQVISRSDIAVFIRFGDQISHYEAVEATYPVKMPKAIERHSRDIDNALAKIRICDPAVGSGAFPVGMMTEIVRARFALTPYFNDVHERTAYAFKWHAIQNCIYGVDLDPGAVDIAKLRLWLSLVVDEEEKKQIKPLPNLDYKIMQGNSLLEEFEGVQLFDDTLIGEPDGRDEKLINDLRDKQISLQAEYVSLDAEGRLTHDKKAQLSADLQAIATKLKNASSSRVRVPVIGLFDAHGDAHRKAAQLRKLHDKFFETTDRQQKETIKRSIAELEWELIEVSLRERGKTAQLKKLEAFRRSRTRPFFLWKLHFAEVFQDNKGFDVVIANPPWVFTRIGDFDDDFKRQINDKYLQNLVGSQTGRAKQSGKVNLFAVFVLQGLLISRPAGHLTYIIPNTFLRATVYDAIRKHLLDRYSISCIVDLSAGRFENVTASTIILEASNSRNDGNHVVKVIDDFSPTSTTHVSRTLPQTSFLNNISYAFNIFADDIAGELLSKVRNSGQRLDGFCDVFAGGIATGPGKNQYISTTRLDDKYKPLIEGKDVRRYRLDFKSKYILYDRKKLYRAREESIFLSPEKLITQRISGGSSPLVVAYDNKRFYTFNSTNSILRNSASSVSLKYILALLNSRLLNWYYVMSFSNKSTLTVNISKTFLEQLPIKKPTASEESKIVGMVDKILIATRSNDYDKSLVRELEDAIDNTVFQMYGLTVEETLIVEGRRQEAVHA